MILEYVPRGMWPGLFEMELNLSLELEVDWYIEACIESCLALYNGEFDHLDLNNSFDK